MVSDIESLIDYKIRICNERENLNMTWEDIEDLLSKKTGKRENKDSIRKWWLYFSQGIAYANGIEIQSGMYLDRSMLSRSTVYDQEERKKIQTEKIEYNKMMREKARMDILLERLEDSIKKMIRTDVPRKINYEKTFNERDAIVGIADVHYGKDIIVKGLNKSVINVYNIKIFEERMWNLLDEIRFAVDREKLKHINLVNLSDSIDGLIHMNQLQTLELGIIDSTIGFSEFMSGWITELSKFVVVDYRSVMGNHSEIRPLGTKSGEFRGENMEKIINWYLSKTLSNNKNVNVYSMDEYCYFKVSGYDILAVHGQDERNLENSIRDYAMIFDENIDALLTGHLHCSNEKVVSASKNGNIEYVQFPSIIGADDYGFNLKKVAKPGSKMLIYEKDIGKTITYDIRLG